MTEFNLHDTSFAATKVAMQAAHAAEALAVFANLSGEEEPRTIGALLAGLHHLADMRNVDFAAELALGDLFYTGERSLMQIDESYYGWKPIEMSRQDIETIRQERGWGLYTAMMRRMAARANPNLDWSSRELLAFRILRDAGCNPLPAVHDGKPMIDMVWEQQRGLMAWSAVGKIIRVILERTEADDARMLLDLLGV